MADTVNRGADYCRTHTGKASECVCVCVSVEATDRLNTTCAGAGVCTTLLLSGGTEVILNK